MQQTAAPRFSVTSPLLVQLNKDDFFREFDARLESKLSLLLGVGPDPIDPDKALTRTQASELIGVSLTQLDLLCRPERRDPIPFYHAGQARRFLRTDLIAWLRRQTEVAA